MSRLPYQDTSVGVEKSLGKIKKMLYEIGFTSIIEKSLPNGNSELIAQISSEGKMADFHFNVNLSEILNKMPCSNRYEPEEQAARIAWRVVFHQIKALCDSIKLGIISIPEAFTGNLLIKDKNGNPQKVGDIAIAAINSGKLQIPELSQVLMLENKNV